MKKSVLISVDSKHDTAAKVAVAKGKATSVKNFYENAIDSASRELYQECADLAGVSLEDWINDKDAI